MKWEDTTGRVGTSNGIGTYSTGTMNNEQYTTETHMISSPTLSVLVALVTASAVLDGWSGQQEPIYEYHTAQEAGEPR